MADTKQTQQGKPAQPEQKKSEPQMPAKPAEVAAPLTEAQKAERQKMIDEAVKKAQEAAMASRPAAANVAEVAKKAIEEVQAKRAAAALNPPADGAADGAQTPSGKRDRWPERKKRSTIANPVQFVHELADAMISRDPTVRRKDVIEAAIDAGVAGYTARTQYQEWYKNRRESQRQAALAEAKRNEQLKASGASR